MKRLIFAFAGALACIGVSTGAQAHHSAAEYNFETPVNITGIVKEASFANPHARIVLEVTDERGTREILFEGHSRNNMYRQGFRPGMMAGGDKVTIRVAPKRDGSDGGYMTAFITADGTPVGQITRAD